MEPTLIYNSMDQLGQPHIAALKSKLNEMIEFSTYTFEKRSSLINIELDGLKKDYQSQILKFNEFLNNPNLSSLNSFSTPLSLGSSIISRSKSPIGSGSRNGLSNNNKTVANTKSNKISKENFYTSQQSHQGVSNNNTHVTHITQSPAKNVKASPSSFSKEIIGHGVHNLNHSTIYSSANSNGLKIKNGATKKSHQDALAHVLSNTVSQKNRQSSPFNRTSGISNLLGSTNEKDSANTSFNHISQSQMNSNAKTFSNSIQNLSKNSKNIPSGTSHPVQSSLINRQANSKYLQPGHHKTSSMGSISSVSSMSAMSGMSGMSSNFSNYYHHLASEKKPANKKSSNSEIVQNGTLKYKASVSPNKEKIMEPLKPGDGLNLNSNPDYELNIKSLSNSQSMTKINSTPEISNQLCRHHNNNDNHDNSRKFSILDIDSSANNFVLMHNNETFLSNKNNMRMEEIQNMLPECCSEIGVSVNINENFNNKELNAVCGDIPRPMLRNDYKTLKSRGLNDRYSMAFYTLAASQIVPIKQRIIFSSMNRKVYNTIHPNEILRDYSTILKEKIEILENQYSFDRQNLDSIFREYPSRTAQNSLNFLTQNNEDCIRSLSDNPLVLQLYEIIFILLSKCGQTKMNLNSDQSKIEFVHREIMPDFECATLKKLFLNVIYKLVFTHGHITQSQMDQIVNILINHPILMKPGELSKINKPLSFFSFTLREIYDYFSQKDPETEEFVFILRKAYSNFKRLQKEHQTLTDLLK